MAGQYNRGNAENAENAEKNERVTRRMLAVLNEPPQPNDSQAAFHILLQLTSVVKGLPVSRQS